MKLFYSGICSRNLSCGYLLEDKNYIQGKKYIFFVFIKIVLQLSYVDVEGYV